MQEYMIRRIHLLSSVSLGMFVGGIIMFLPGLMVGVLARWLIREIRFWLESLTVVQLTSFLEVNLLELLQLTTVLEYMQRLDDLSWLLLVGIVLVFVTIGVVVAGFTNFMAAIIYNAASNVTGGLVVSAEPVGGRSIALSGIPALPSSPVVAAPPPSIAAKRGQTQIMPQSPASTPIAGIPQAQLASEQNPEQNWPVQLAITSIGSSTDNDVVLPGLLPRHAEIRFDNNRFLLHSMNGGQVRVNNHLVQTVHMLKEGFKIDLGGHRLTFHEG